MASDNEVELVERTLDLGPVERARKRSRERHVPENSDAPVAVRTEPAVKLDESPGLVALVLGQLLDEAQRFRMLQR